MKQVKITITTPMWVQSETFNAQDINKQIKFMTKAKKLWMETGNTDGKLSCSIEEINFVAAVPAVKQVQKAKPVRQDIQIIPLIKKNSDTIFMENKEFVYYPAKHCFISTDKRVKLSKKSAVELFEFNLLQIEKNHVQMFKALINS
jgi:hypothetical protein